MGDGTWSALLGCGVYDGVGGDIAVVAGLGAGVQGVGVVDIAL